MSPDDLDVIALGERLYLRRKRLGLEQDEVADRAGVSRAYLSRLENGKVEGPKLTDLRRVATVLGLSLPELLSDEGRAPTRQNAGDDDPEFAALLRDLRRASPSAQRWLRETLEFLNQQREHPEKDN